MEAPDKIYIAETPNKLIEIWSDEPIESKPYITEHEYIRKDALLEWLRNEYETISWYYEKMQHVTGSVGDNSSYGKVEAYKKVIDKIESL